MKRRHFLELAVGAAATPVLPCFIFAADGPPVKKLNFVFFLIEDLGWRDLDT